MTIETNIDSFQNSAIDCFTEKLKTAIPNLSNYFGRNCDRIDGRMLDYSAIVVIAVD